MFSSSQTLGSRKPSPLSYSDVAATSALDGASPHKLVSLLYGALAEQIANARGAITRRDIGAKHRAIAHALRIVEEGLRAPLDLRAGGALAANLHDLYEYMGRQLTLANLRDDQAALLGCARLTELLRDGWDGIKAQADAAPRMAA